MNVYLDTSSLVKLYVEEEDSSAVANLVDSSTYTATSIVAYAEARAAFARRFRENAFGIDEHDRIKSNLDKDWNHYLVLYITENLIKLAGELSEKHALRGFDAIHLASAIALYRDLSSPIVFSCFDNHLATAAECEELLKNQ